MAPPRTAFGWTLKDVVSLAVMLVAIVVWGVRLESKTDHHNELPWHAGMPGHVESRINEKLALARARDAVAVGSLTLQISQLREEVTRLRDTLKMLQRVVIPRARRAK